MKDLFAEVIVPLPLHDRFTYRIPDTLRDRVKPGIRVLVPFGRRKIYSALVTAITEDAPGAFEVKQLETILDTDPVIHPVNLELWQWIAAYYMSTAGEVMNAAMPTALKPEGKDGHIEDSYREKTRQVIRLTPELEIAENLEAALNTLSRSPKQKSLLQHIAGLAEQAEGTESGSVDRKRLLQGTGTGESVLAQLIRKGFLVIHHEVVSRLSHAIPEQADINLLNVWQQEALEKIREQFREKQTVLLHGVTASGKTEIYIHLMDEACRRGKQVLYLVPEIALTPQIISRLKRVFGQKVGVYHSKLSDSERVEVWNKVLGFRNGTGQGYQVIIGARSAIFLPFERLGLLIVDEEHENSYKQHDPAPRYHARDMAVILGHQHSAPVLLGSATPSFESYFNALNGKYGLVRLQQRHGNAGMPQIQVANLQRAYKRKQMISILTPELHEGITHALKEKEQVILFQNRRGYSPFVECMDCGWIPVCVNCDVSLTYHKRQGRLSCHYCGHHLGFPDACPRCGSADIKKRGTGTEKMEDEIIRIFPEARVARMDLDSTRSKTAFEKIIHQLETRKIDILAGTQMVTKGLDIEHVGLVGVLNADNLLNYPDFRAHERAFQLMQQVSGRSGRKDREGKVIIQTSQPQHAVIRYLLNHDFESFFDEHSRERKAFFYPPWFKLIKIVLKHKNQSVLDSAALVMVRTLRNLSPAKVLGPEYPLINRIQQYYAKEIWIKIPRNAPAIEIKQEISAGIRTTKALPGNSNLMVQVDVDP